MRILEGTRAARRGLWGQICPYPLAVWEGELERLKSLERPEPLPDEDDGVPRALQVEVGTSTVIESGEAGPEVSTGRLLAVRVHEISEAEAARLRSLEG